MATKQKINKSAILKKLQKGMVEIRFTKLSGGERIMKATLRKDLIPESLWPNSVNEDYNTRGDHNECRVFDTEIGEWRSFLWDRLNSATPL